MIIKRVVHQQIFQLRWQLLACLGLIMVLPLEEAAVNLVEGAGFYAEHMLLVTLFLSPFLAGLIACANVQADLDEKRYIFWMSKPVGIKSFITLKYLVGLVLALFVIACPVVFAIVSNAIYEADVNFVSTADGGVMILVAALISLLTYSLCFLCNVLVRKTARAWLIGITATGFLLLVPFMLPLNFKDVATDIVRLASSIYVVVFLAVTVGAFVVSLFAVKHSWHVQTNLKGLFWAVAGFAFVLMVMFSRQVANIKVLDTIKIDVPIYHRIDSINGNLVLYSDHSSFEDINVNIVGNQIKLENIKKPSAKLDKLENSKPLYEVEQGLRLNKYPRHQKVIYTTDGNTYFFELYRYSLHEKKGERRNTSQDKHLYLHSNKMLGGCFSVPAAALDISDLLTEDYNWPVIMRLVGDKLAVFAGNNFAVVKVNDAGEFELLDIKINAVKRGLQHLTDRKKVFKIPLVSAQGISIEERVKLTIDYIYGSHYYFASRSIVDRHDNLISFVLVSEFDIARYDVVKWDKRFIYCKFRDTRPFTFLEQMFDKIDGNSNCFIKDGKLYAYEYRKLMVFDMCSDRIRKLGHFERLSEDFIIEDIDVFGDGNILLNATIELREPEEIVDKYGHRFVNIYHNSYLYLLKNPE